MKSKLIWSILSCVMITILLLNACGGEATEETTTTPSTQTTPTTQTQTTPTTQTQTTPTQTQTTPTTQTQTTSQYGGILTSILPEVESLDPADAINRANLFSSFTHETLCIYHWEWPTEKCGFYATEMDGSTNPQNDFNPNLAISFEIIDPTTTIFHLRHGVKWNAGLPQAREILNDREFTADDVMWHFNYIMNSPKQSRRFTNLESVTALDKYTVEFKAKQPDIFLTSDVATGSYTYIHAHEVADKYGDFKDWQNNVGTGPFILTEYIKGTSATYEKNPDYWGYDEKYPSNSIPYVDEVKLLFITDQNTQIAAFRTGMIDLITRSGFNRYQIADLEKTNEGMGIARFNTDNQYWTLRNDVEPFDNINVRYAMNMAVNREEIFNDFYGGEAELWGYPYAPCLKDCYMPFESLPQDIKDIYTYNPQKAEQLLDEAGYPRDPNTGIRFNTNLVYYAPTGSEIHEKNALMKSYMDDIGIDVDLRLVDAATNSSMRYGFTYDQMYGDAMATNEPEQNYRLWFISDAIFNRCRINDPYIDETVAKALTITDFNKRRELLRELDYYVLQQAHAVIPVNPYDYTIWQQRVKGYAGQRTLGFCGIGPVFARIWLDQ